MSQEYVFHYKNMSALVKQPIEVYKTPLVLYLHGWFESGEGCNVAEMQNVKDARNSGFLTCNLKAFDNATILMPQCKPNQWWDECDLKDMLDVFRQKRTFTHTVLIGISMGGFAAWKMLERFGSEFQTAVVVAGGDSPRDSCVIRTCMYALNMTTPSLDVIELRAQKKLPNIFIVHGVWDPIVPFRMAKRCYSTVKDLTPTTFITYDGCSGMGHHAWKAECCQSSDWWARVLDLS